ncbi:MAG: M20 family metallopeptidase [Bacteroidota bacterium]
MTKKTEQDLASRIHDLANDLQPEAVAVRRYMHRNPELSFKEFKTAAYLADQLKQIGIPFKSIAETGLLAEIEGQAGPGPTFALRSDHDALPILEANEVPYKSQNLGIMHACGHDVHTTCLLTAAKILWRVRGRFAGTIRLLFQPGEEKAPGGASIMIAEGALQNPEPIGIIGQHVHPPLEVGKIGMRPGLYMASTDELYLTIHGKGGHGGIPQSTVDPIAISAQVISALQQLVSRQADPTMPTVLTFGKIESVGGANNVIPNAVKLEGTLRTHNEEWRTEMCQRIGTTASGIAEALGGRAELNITKGYPYLENDEDLTRAVFADAQAYLGPENVVELPPRMTGEDFSFYSHQIPACFYRLGTGNQAKGITSPVHTDTFDVDEACLEVGSGMMAWLAIKQLQRNAD